jgi:hypothetical protein
VSSDNVEKVKLIKKPSLVYGGEASFDPDIAKWLSRSLKGPTTTIIYPKPYGTHAPFNEEHDIGNGVTCRNLINKDVCVFFNKDF